MRGYVTGCIYRDQYPTRPSLRFYASAIIIGKTGAGCFRRLETGFCKLETVEARVTGRLPPTGSILRASSTAAVPSARLTYRGGSTLRTAWCASRKIAANDETAAQDGRPMNLRYQLPVDTVIRIVLRRVEILKCLPCL
jgi:hypothetical protein